MEPTSFGKYTLVARLASGGMAEVLLGVERAGGAARRLVGIKRVREEHRSDPRYADYFLGEARLSLQCVHPNLPQVYELGEAEGLQYLALEYIRGVTLLDLVRAAHRAGARLSVPAVVAVAAGVAAGLQYLHELRDLDGSPLSVIHRDVSPANVMVTYDGAVKLIDLGIARNALQCHQTVAGTFKGKFSYQAPEQIRGGAKVDHRVDLFLLGIVMHEALTGRSLFRGADNRDTLLRVLGAPIPDPGAGRDDVPPALTAVIRRALARDPDERYASAAELLADLEQVAEQARLPRSARLLRDEVTALCGPPEAIAVAPAAPARGPLPEVDVDVSISDVEIDIDFGEEPDEPVGWAVGSEDREVVGEDYVIEEYLVHDATTLSPRRDPDFDALLAWLEPWRSFSAAAPS